MKALLLGLSLGLAAGVSPGPLLVLVMTATLRSGWRAGAVAACGPLVTDVIVVTGVLLVLDRLPSRALAVLGVVGGGFVIYLGVTTARDARSATLAIPAGESTSRGGVLRSAALVNVLSPHPWVAWATALGPLTVATWHRGAAGAVLLVLGFYVSLVGAKIAVAGLVSGARRRLSDRGYRRALTGAGLLLVLAGIALVLEFGPEAL